MIVPGSVRIFVTTKLCGIVEAATVLGGPGHLISTREVYLQGREKFLELSCLAHEYTE